MTSPRVSVFIPAYDRERLVGDAVRSTLVQTFTDLECIVVDDGSSDATSKTVEAFNDPRPVSCATSRTSAFRARATAAASWPEASQRLRVGWRTARVGSHGAEPRSLLCCLPAGQAAACSREGLGPLDALLELEECKTSRTNLFFQCQRCKQEPLCYDPVPDMIQMAENDPDPKVRRGALGGMAIQPPDPRLVASIDRLVECSPELGEEKGVGKLLQHHLHACTLEELLERVEHDAPTRVRQAAAENLRRHEASAEAAVRLERLVAAEENEILRRCLERGFRHHAGS